MIRVTRINSSGGNPTLLALPLEFLPGWLFEVDAARGRPELREKIIRYRRECYRVLAEAFKEETLPFASEATSADFPSREPNPVLVQLREQGLALAKMAEEQMEIEAKALEALDQAYYAHSRLNEFGKFVYKLDLRMDEVEKLTRPGAPVSEEQAANIAMGVKALADFLTTRLGPKDATTGKVHYQSVFDAIYKHFGVYSYKLIQKRDYAGVIKFIEDWRIAAGGKPQPQQQSLDLDEN